MKTRLLTTACMLGILTFVASCSSNTKKTTNEEDEYETSTGAANQTPGDDASTTSDNPKGVGKFSDVKLTHPLDQSMVKTGKSVYDLKCASCHKLNDEKLVGPGWKGVTDRRTPEWIMNFVTNTDEMLEKDVEAKNLYETCLVKMPNQNLSDKDARDVLEFMRENDGKK